MLAVGIVLYLAILRSLDVRRFARGLSVGVLILGLEELGFPYIPAHAGTELMAGHCVPVDLVFLAASVCRSAAIPVDSTAQLDTVQPS
jgi:hypothetical protein